MSPRQLASPRVGSAGNLGTGLTLSPGPVASSRPMGDPGQIPASPLALSPRRAALPPSGLPGAAVPRTPFSSPAIRAPGVGAAPFGLSPAPPLPMARQLSPGGP